MIRALQMHILTGCLVLAFGVVPCAADENMPEGSIELDETVISGNQELPKVLYIVPWQQPNGLPEIELKTQFAEETLFRRLYPPAYRREMTYFQNLNGTDPEE